MKLHEFQAKRLLVAYGVPAPEGDIAATPEEAGAVAERLGPPVVVKAQALVGGRGKAGGIVVAETVGQTVTAARRMLGQPLKGLMIRQVLVERAVPIAGELYLGLALDRAARRMLLMASTEGGVEIEETARVRPQAIQRLLIDPWLGLRAYQVTHISAAMGLPRPLWAPFSQVAQCLYRAAQEADATLAEINPLAVVNGGALIALDAKMVIDDGALFRHPGLERDIQEETPAERKAREAGISYVKLDGHIACMVNGAGLAMATMDIIKLYGGEPANFLDIGGGAREDRVIAALEIILADPDVDAVLINIFGGITRCDEVATGIVKALARLQPSVPLIMRLIGTREDEGRRILVQARISTAATLSEGAQRAVEAARLRRAAREGP